jgi:hypothetical protein
VVERSGAPGRDDLIGDDRPPSRRGTALLVVLAVLLAGLAANRLLRDPGMPPPAAGAAPQPRHTASSPPPIPDVAPSDLHDSALDVPLPSPPWDDLPTVARGEVDYAVGNQVHWAGRTFRLHDGDLVVDMEQAARGPVVLVQSSGRTLLEQLRPDGSTLVLDEFRDESRHLQGLAVDPDGERIAYALTSSSPQGPFGLVVRDLATGAVLHTRVTVETYAVRDWVRSGVVLEVARDPGAPPYRWVPGARRPRQITPFAAGGVGPFLVAASPTRDAWAVRTEDCTSLVRLGSRPDPDRCLPEVAGPAAWSSDGTRLAGRGDTPALLTVDTRTDRTTRVTSLRQMFLAQVVWQDDDSMLVAVHTLADRRGAVLGCSVGGGCSRLRLGSAGEDPDLVLAQ